MLEPYYSVYTISSSFPEKFRVWVAQWPGIPTSKYKELLVQLKKAITFDFEE